MAESGALTENTKVPIKFALYIGGVFVLGLLAFTDVKGDVRSLKERADANDTRDAASVADRQAQALQLQALKTYMETFGKTLDEVKSDLKDVKKSTVPEESVVRAGGRR